MTRLELILTGILLIAAGLVSILQTSHFISSASWAKNILCSDVLSWAMKIKWPFRRRGKVFLPPKVYENLFQLLAGYLNSDFHICGPELEDAVAKFIEVSPIEIIEITRREIASFLQDNAATLEDSLHRLSSDVAREPDMSAHDYLLWLDELLAKGADTKKKC